MLDDPERLKKLVAPLYERDQKWEEESSDLIDVAGFYSGMEIPEAEPIAGWSLEIPDDGRMCYFVKPANNRFGLMSYKLMPEAQEWCDDNLRDRYWVLGSGFDMERRTLMFYFTSEHDYILFKMRWG